MPSTNSKLNYAVDKPSRKVNISFAAKLVGAYRSIEVPERVRIRRFRSRSWHTQDHHMLRQYRFQDPCFCGSVSLENEIALKIKGISNRRRTLFDLKVSIHYCFKKVYTA